MTDDAWRKCSTCKTPIAFDSQYYECSVSTCNRKRTALFFCSVSCWDAHVPTMRHRDAWAIEKRAPTREAWERELEQDAAGASGTSTKSTAAASSSNADSGATSGRAERRVEPAAPTDDALPRDVLIVASKLKKYIKAKSGMNTSDTVMGVLSDYVRDVCDQAIRHAAQDERKTVLDRDVLKVTD